MQRRERELQRKIKRVTATQNNSRVVLEFFSHLLWSPQKVVAHCPISSFSAIQICSSLGEGERGRERERERQTDRQTDRQIETDRY